MVYHATGGPPKIGPPGLSATKYVAVDGPPRPSMAAILGPAGPSTATYFAAYSLGGPILGDHLWHDRCHNLHKEY